MKRRKQEITDKEEIEEIIRNAEICHLAMCKDDIPYVIPLNFGYHQGALYFHCAEGGLKVDILKANDRVCFQLETGTTLITNDTPCSWSQLYRSVIGFGRARFLHTREEKREALEILLRHYDDAEYEIPDEKVDGVTIIKVIIESMTGKRDAD